MFFGRTRRLGRLRRGQKHSCLIEAFPFSRLYIIQKKLLKVGKWRKEGSRSLRAFPCAHHQKKPLHLARSGIHDRKMLYSRFAAVIVSCTAALFHRCALFADPPVLPNPRFAFLASETKKRQLVLLLLYSFLTFKSFHPNPCWSRCRLCRFLDLLKSSTQYQYPSFPHSVFSSLSQHDFVCFDARSRGGYNRLGRHSVRL